MKQAIFYVTTLCFFYLKCTVSDELDVNSKLNDYLKNKSFEITFEDIIIEKLGLDSHVNVEEIATSSDISGNYKGTFSLFDKTFMWLGNELHQILISNGAIVNLEKVKELSVRGDITFTKVIQFKDMGFILLKIKNDIEIYGYDQNEIFHIHSVFSLYTSDAHFFINQDFLYLIIVNNKGLQMAVTTIYKWLGSHFDETEHMYTTGAIKASSFTSDGSEIIIILQNIPNKEVPSLVFEFKFDTVKAIQHLQTGHPVYLDIYTTKTATYVCIFKITGNNIIYTWDGSTLVETFRFERDMDKEVIFFMPSNMPSNIASSAVFVVSPSKDKVEVFRIAADEMKLIGEGTYSSNFSLILGINKGSNITYIIGLNENNKLCIRAMAFKIHLNSTEGRVRSKDMLRNCFNTLEMGVYNQKRRLKEARRALSQIKVGASKKSINNGSERVSDIEEDQTSNNDLNTLRRRLKMLQSTLESYKDKRDITINNPVIINGSIEAEQLTGRNVDIKTINGHDWLPKNWLRYKLPQNITGPVTVNKIIVAQLNTTALDPLFTDLLRKHEDQDIRGKLQIVNLTANKILTQKINNVQLENIYLKIDPQPIQGLKTFKNFKTTEATIEQLNKKSPNKVLTVFNTDSSSKNSIFDNHLEVENLVVETIDNVHWDTFRDSVFRINITKEINGDLTFPEVKANNMTLKTLNGTRVEHLLTTSTDQIVNADIEVIAILAENIIPNTTNGIKLSESAVQIEDKTFIECPVKFDNLYVSKNLELVGKLDKEFFLMNGGHIIGTNESDLWQQYDGAVKIKGNLYLKNISLQPKAKLSISGKKFNPDIGSIYWTKSTKQSIPTHLTAKNGLHVPHLLLNQLNDINFSQYMLNKNLNTFETIYRFENVSVLGDVSLNHRNNHSPNLTKLNKEAVKTIGSYYIKGKLTYMDTLRVENLAATILDGVSINDTLTTKSAMNITEKKTFRNITVKGNLTCDIQSLDSINGVNITDLLANTIYINEPSNLEKIRLKNITVENLWVTKLNNRPINKYIANIQKILGSNNINNLIIVGNVSLKDVTGVSKLNNIEFEELLNKSLKIGQHGGILVNLEFVDPVKIGNLAAVYINDINLIKLTKRFLYRNTTQNITATYSFNNIKTDNIVVSEINDKSMNNIIDVTTSVPQTIYAPLGILFTSAIMEKSLNTSETSPPNLIDALKKIKNPPTQNWRNVKIEGNATFLDEGSILYRIFEKAVTTNTKNVIQSSVQFSKHVMTQNVISEGHFNDINLQEVINDAVLTESEEEQVITGRKIFPTLKLSSAVVMKNTDVPVVNNIDIPELNKVIVRKDDTDNYGIKGHKTFFGGLQCDKFYSEKVSNIDVDNIVSADNPRKIPLAAFDSIKVNNNLHISSVNHFDFDGFLKNRLLTESVNEQTVSGVHFFENIQIERTETLSINSIKMDNVVFDIGQQNISTAKHFTQTVEIFGNLTCTYINGINLSEKYKNSLSLEDDISINGNMTVLRPAVVDGRITTKYINGYAVENIKEILHQGTVKSKTDQIQHIQSDIVDIIKRNIHRIKFLASDYMYIEKTQVLQISVPNTLSAKTMQSNGYMLIHIDGVESGDYCGLPESCKCPVQYSIDVSPEHSVTIFPNKWIQRIYSYNDDGMIVHFLTNSFSTDTICRSDSAKVINEGSMLTWNSPQVVNTTGSFYNYDQYITGYISGAEFFTLHGQTYAVIGRYYDPTTDSHDLDCYLIKFSKDKSKATQIQKIPTKGAWSIYLFHTAQGVTLIIGNIKTRNTHNGEEETQIYRFNEYSQKFDVLRIIPAYGCSMATGVVLGTDSLIVLAHEYAPLKVLKYNSYFDNYYFYQNFELEAPVVGMSVFYTGGFGISDAYLCIVTANENYFVYSFRFIEGWKLESSGELEGLRNLVPFELKGQLYLLAPSSKISSLLTVVKHGSV